MLKNLFFFEEHICIIIELYKVNTRSQLTRKISAHLSIYKFQFGFGSDLFRFDLDTINPFKLFLKFKNHIYFRFKDKIIYYI